MVQGHQLQLRCHFLLFHNVEWSDIKLLWAIQKEVSCISLLLDVIDFFAFVWHA